MKGLCPECNTMHKADEGCPTKAEELDALELFEALLRDKDYLKYKADYEARGHLSYHGQVKEREAPVRQAIKELREEVVRLEIDHATVYSAVSDAEARAEAAEKERDEWRRIAGAGIDNPVVHNAAMEEAAGVAKNKASQIMDEFHLSGIMPLPPEVNKMGPLKAAREMLNAYNDLVRRFEEGMPAAIRELKRNDNTEDTP